LLGNDRFRAMVNGDAEFVEEYGPEDEGQEWRRASKYVSLESNRLKRGDQIEVEVDVDGLGTTTWQSAEVVKLLGNDRFRAMVNGDAEFVEEYGPEDEGQEWRRASKYDGLKRQRKSVEHYQPGEVPRGGPPREESAEERRARREAEIRAEKARLQGIEDGKKFAKAQIIAGMKIQACLRGALVRKRNRRQKRLRQLRDPDGFDWCCVNKQGKNALKVMLAERERMAGCSKAQQKQHLKMMLNDPEFLETKVTKYLEERYATEEPPEIAELRLAAQKAEAAFQEMQRVAAFKAEQARLQKEMKAAVPARKRADLTFSSGSAASLEEARANLAHVPIEQKLSTVPRLNLDKSATIIQSRSRGQLARQQTSMLMLEKRGPPSARAAKVLPPVPRLNLDKSATVIQARSRGKLARQQTSMLMLEKRGPPSAREKVPRIHLNFTVIGDHVSIDWVVALE